MRTHVTDRSQISELPNLVTINRMKNTIKI